jgi:hypothetical protein
MVVFILRCFRAFQHPPTARVGVFSPGNFLYIYSRLPFMMSAEHTSSDATDIFSLSGLAILHLTSYSRSLCAEHTATHTLPLSIKQARALHTLPRILQSSSPLPPSPPRPTPPSPPPSSRFPYVPFYRTSLHSMAPLVHEVEPSTMVRRYPTARRHPVPAIPC